MNAPAEDPVDFRRRRNPTSWPGFRSCISTMSLTVACPQSFSRRSESCRANTESSASPWKRSRAGTCGRGRNSMLRGGIGQCVCARVERGGAVPCDGSAERHSLVRATVRWSTSPSQLPHLADDRDHGIVDNILCEAVGFLAETRAAAQMCRHGEQP